MNEERWLNVQYKDHCEYRISRAAWRSPSAAARAWRQAVSSSMPIIRSCWSCAGNNNDICSYTLTTRLSCGKLNAQHRTIPCTCKLQTVQVVHTCAWYLLGECCLGSYNHKNKHNNYPVCWFVLLQWTLNSKFILMCHHVFHRCRKQFHMGG